jgi:hypothetical protein
MTQATVSWKHCRFRQEGQIVHLKVWFCPSISVVAPNGDKEILIHQPNGQDGDKKRQKWERSVVQEREYHRGLKQLLRRRVGACVA